MNIGHSPTHPDASTRRSPGSPARQAPGTFRGGDFRVNSVEVSDQDHPAIDVEDDGDFVVAWESDLQDGSSFGIRSRRFRGNYLFRDSFESRNTAAWSATLP